MNSYFASVEQQAVPHLRGRPVGVCEHLGGIIIAPSVEAKRLGITLGTPTWEAVKKCPEIVLLHTDPDKYRSVTDRFMRILSDYTEEVERYSIDEAFLPHPCKHKGEGCLDSCYNDALLLALEIKQRMRQEIGKWVSCSIGIGPNKLVAKIAADLPRSKSAPPEAVAAATSGRLISNGVKARKVFLDNLCVIKPEQVGMLYNVLQLTDIPGIGTRLEKRLAKLGIFGLRQLAEYPVENLINQFGVTGYFLHQISNFNSGHSDRFVDSDNVLPKSIGHMYTLPKPTNSLADLKKLLMKLSEKVGRRLRKKQARAGLVHYFHGPPYNSPLTKGGKEGGWYRKQRKLPEYIQDSRDIYKYAWGILRTRINPAGELSSGVKIMGVSVGRLDFTSPPEPLLQTFKKPVWATRAADEINDKYGEFTLHSARMMDTPDEWGKDSVGFG